MAKIFQIGKLLKIKRFGREEILVFGTVVFLVLLLVLIGWDGLIFYNFVLHRQNPEPQIKRPVVFTASDLDNVLKMLDERRQKLNEILVAK